MSDNTFDFSEFDTMDLWKPLGSGNYEEEKKSATAEKKPIHLEVLLATQDLVDKAFEASEIEKQAKKLQADFEAMKAQIIIDGAKVQAMVKNYDPSFDAGFFAMLPENLNVRQLQRIAELHKDLSSQGYNVRLLGYSHSSENNWIAWKSSLLKGNISVEIITRKIETDEYHRTSFDVSGKIKQSTELNLLSIELEGITFDEMDSLMLAQDPQLITLASNTQDCQQKTTIRHRGIRLIAPTAHSLPTKLSL